MQLKNYQKLAYNITDMDKVTNEILNKWKYKLSEDINKLIGEKEIWPAIIADALIDLCEAIEEYLDNNQTDK